MSAINGDIRRILADPQTIKVLATSGRDGAPHAVFTDLADTTENGELIVLTQFEFSRTNQNLVYSLWFSRPAALSLKTTDGKSYSVTARPHRCVITGKLFEKYYDLVRARNPGADLAAVWVLVPEQVREETYAVRCGQERRAHPIFTHLDQIAKD